MSRFVSYDVRTVTVNDDHATLVKRDERVTTEFVLPDEQRDTPHPTYLFNNKYNYNLNRATLHYNETEG